jgi:tetratricopeptide (TPR) repeat protein
MEQQQQVTEPRTAVRGSFLRQQLPAEEVARMRKAAVERRRAGDWDRAQELYSTLFRHAVATADAPEMVSSLHGHVQVCHGQDRLEEAEELATLSWEIARRHDLALERARSLNAMALVQYRRGVLPRAVELYQQALEQARDVGDDALVGFACQNLGVIANIQGNLREARVLYLESIGASTRVDNKQSAMMVYSNLGMLCSDMEEWLEAGVYFDRGVEIAQRLGDFAQLGRLHVNRAEPLIQIEEHDAALASLDRAEEHATRVGARATLADVARFRARIARLQGDHAAAERHVEHSLQIADAAQLPLLRGEALEELGQLRRTQGDHDEAVRLLEEALRCFRGVGAERDAERAASVLAQWSSTGAHA